MTTRNNERTQVQLHEEVIHVLKEAGFDVQVTALRDGKPLTNVEYHNVRALLAGAYYDVAQRLLAMWKAG